MLFLLFFFIFQAELELRQVTVSDFQKFVEATDYMTDAERYGWSIVQKDIWAYDLIEGATWKCPDGNEKSIPHQPVTQISYNDALAYCKWAGTRLPTYDEYFVIAENNPQHLRGVWEITTTEDKQGNIRLAGGSFLCNVYCKGWKKERALFVDKTTGNIHIGFSVIN